MRITLLLSAAAALLLAGCVDGKVQCDAPKATCDLKCTNLETDPANCGACGQKCGTGQICFAGKCDCSGSTLCGSACADTRSNPLHCGACGKACATGALCQDGQCVLDCSAPKTACSGSCVDLKTDRNHCGACGTACLQGQSCDAGTCRSIVYATCFNTGELVALDDALKPAANSTLVGAGPYSIAASAEHVLVADTIDNALYSFDPKTAPPEKKGADGLGKVVNQVLVNGTRAYVINSGDNNVQVIDLGKPLGSARSIDQIKTAVGTQTSAANTNPAFGAIIGERLFVTLTGTFDAEGHQAGNRLLDIDLSGPTGRVAGQLVFDPKDFEKDETAAANSPRPAGIAALGSKLYIAIGNLAPTPDPVTWAVPPAGPGYLAVVETAGGQLKAETPIELPSVCRNPAYVLATATRIYISCPGSYGWGATQDESLIVLDAANRKLVNATTFPRCAATDPTEGPDACRTMVPGRLAVHGDKLLIADNNAGRLFVTDLNGKLLEKGEEVVQLCPPKCLPGGKTCYQLTSDVFALH